MRIRPAPTPLFQFNLPLTWLQVGSLNNFIEPVTRLTKKIGWTDATRSKLGLSLVLNHRNQHLHGWLQCTAMQSLELLLFVIALQQMLILGVIMQHYWGADVSTNRANNISQTRADIFWHLVPLDDVVNKRERLSCQFWWMVAAAVRGTDNIKAVSFESKHILKNKKTVSLRNNHMFHRKSKRWIGRPN